MIKQIMRGTQTYRLFGLTIESDTPLSGFQPLEPARGETASVRLSNVSPVSPIDLQEWHLLKRVLADPRGKNWSLYLRGGYYLLDYDGLLQFCISRDGGQVEYSMNRGDLGEFFRWAFLHLVLLFVLHLKSIPAYHAGAVQVPSGALLFFWT